MRILLSLPAEFRRCSGQGLTVAAASLLFSEPREAPGAIRFRPAPLNEWKASDRV